MPVLVHCVRACTGGCAQHRYREGRRPRGSYERACGALDARRPRHGSAPKLQTHFPRLPCSTRPGSLLLAAGRHPGATAHPHRIMARTSHSTKRGPTDQATAWRFPAAAALTRPAIPPTPPSPPPEKSLAPALPPVAQMSSTLRLHRHPLGRQVMCVRVSGCGRVQGGVHTCGATIVACAPPLSEPVTHPAAPSLTQPPAPILTHLTYPTPP